MATTDAEILELYRVSLTNAASQPAIAQVLDEFGYGPEKLAEGRAKLDNAFAAYHGKGVEDNETSAARHAFDTKKDQLAGLYALDRRKAKAVFRKEPLLSDRLKVDGSMPRTYMKWLETVRTFYAVCLADPELQKRLLPTKITPEYLGTTYALITELEAARTDYIREKGESQNATKVKDAAFGVIDDWMRDFYAIARIALEDSSQLLESLGKLVRS